MLLNFELSPSMEYQIYQKISLCLFQIKMVNYLTNLSYFSEIKMFIYETGYYIEISLPITFIVYCHGHLQDKLYFKINLFKIVLR